MLESEVMQKEGGREKASRSPSFFASSYSADGAPRRAYDKTD